MVITFGIYFQEHIDGIIFVEQKKDKRRSSDKVQKVIWRSADAAYNPYGIINVKDLVVVRDSDGDNPYIVFNNNGEVVRRIGARGEGPGEFQRARIGGSVGDSLLALTDLPSNIIKLYNIKKRNLQVQ